MKQKRKWGLWAAVEYLLSFFSQSPVFTLCAPHPPCLLGLKAAAVFVWSAKTLLPLLAFHQGCMGEKVGRKALVGVWVGGCFLRARGGIFSFIWTCWSNWWRGHIHTNLTRLFLDAQFPIDISSVTRDHDFLDRDAIEALCRWDYKSY